MVNALSQYSCSPFEADGDTRDVYRKGSGPAVIVMAEMPGITPKVLAFAERVIALGCTVYLPHLFGQPGKGINPATVSRAILPACVSKDFSAWALNTTSPVTVWLRALARHAHEECGGPGVGAIGMCWTGGFALGMMVDPSVIAPVLSQPSLPVATTKRHRADIGLSPQDLAVVKERAEDGVCVLGLRFSGDPMVPQARFDTLERELGDRFIGVTIDSSKGNAAAVPRSAHSVVTEHLVDEPGHPTREALDQVLDFFRDRLLVTA